MFITGQRTISTAPRNPSRKTLLVRSSTRTFLSPRPTHRPPTGPRPTCFRLTTANCARTFTLISRTAPTWWNIGTGFERRQPGDLLEGCPFARLGTHRAYAEVSRTAHELERIGPHLVGLKIHSQVAILWSRDSLNAISFMPFASSGGQWSFGLPLLTTPRWFSRCTARSTIEHQLGLCLSHHCRFFRLQAAHRTRSLHLGRRPVAAKYRIT